MIGFSLVAIVFRLHLLLNLNVLLDGIPDMGRMPVRLSLEGGEHVGNDTLWIRYKPMSELRLYYQSVSSSYKSASYS